jgi:hypothetical protein
MHRRSPRILLTSLLATMLAAAPRTAAAQT